MNSKRLRISKIIQNSVFYIRFSGDMAFFNVHKSIRFYELPNSKSIVSFALTIFEKRFILDAWHGSEHTSVIQC